MTIGILKAKILVHLGEMGVGSPEEVAECLGDAWTGVALPGSFSEGP